MNEEKFTAFMKQARKPPGTIKGYINSVKVFEGFLNTYGQGKKLDEATPKDLKDFVSWGIKELDNVYRCLWGVRAYYGCTNFVEMENTSSALMESVQNETRKLSAFLKVDRDTVDKLSLIGINTVNQLLDVSQTREEREALAEKSGLSLDSILELVKLSNLSRLPGLAKTRCRLYYEGGLDTLPKIASLEPEDVQTILTEHIMKTGFNGSPPAFSEAKAAITMARFLLETVDL